MPRQSQARGLRRALRRSHAGATPEARRVARLAWRNAADVSRLGAAVAWGREPDEYPLLPGTPDLSSLPGNPDYVVGSFAPEPACADRPRRGQHGRDAPQSIQPGAAIRDAGRGGSRCDDGVDRRGAGEQREVYG